MLAIIDYGVGNLYSLKCSLNYLGIENTVTNDKKIIAGADGLILPGVGAFRDAAEKLHVNGLDAVITEQAKNGKPLLGICLGMQMLFTKSYEYGEHDGLDLIKGSVRSISGGLTKNLKIPHIGWNRLETKPDAKLFKYGGNGEYVYFVHSYHAEECSGSICAVAEYGTEITAAVESGNIFGMQFHPEKSGDAGLKMLRAFADIVTL